MEFAQYRGNKIGKRGADTPILTMHFLVKRKLPTTCNKKITRIIELQENEILINIFVHLLININVLIVPLYGIFCQPSSKETWKCTKSLRNIIRWLQQRLHYKTLLSKSGKYKVEEKLFWILILEMFKSSKKN